MIIKKIGKSNITWTAKQLVKMNERDTITFENTVQRGLVWDIDRKSLLMHSMIVGYPIPPFYASKTKEKVYDMLDSKQRNNAIFDYFNDIFALTNVPEIEVINDNGDIEYVDINGLKFSELPEEIKDELEGCTFTIYYFEDLTDEQISEMFFRLNNGKPLTSIELSRVKAKSLGMIQEIGKHEIFNSALTEKALKKYTNEEIVIKSYIMLHEEEPSNESKFVRTVIETAELTEQDKEQLNEIYTRILNVHNMIENKKIAKRLLTRTHLISVVPIFWKSLEIGLSEQQIKEWVEHFFAGTKSATISEEYNINSGAGSARKSSVMKRLSEIEKDFNEFFNEFSE